MAEVAQMNSTGTSKEQLKAIRQGIRAALNPRHDPPRPVAGADYANNELFWYVHNYLSSIIIASGDLS